MAILQTECFATKRRSIRQPSFFDRYFASSSDCINPHGIFGPEVVGTVISETLETYHNLENRFSSGKSVSSKQRGKKTWAEAFGEHHSVESILMLVVRSDSGSTFIDRIISGF